MIYDPQDKANQARPRAGINDKTLEVGMKVYDYREYPMVNRNEYAVKIGNLWYYDVLFDNGKLHCKDGDCLDIRGVSYFVIMSELEDELNALAKA